MFYLKINNKKINILLEILCLNLRLGMAGFDPRVHGTATNLEFVKKANEIFPL